MPRSAENRPDRGQPAEAPQLEQPQAPEARVALAADHQMIVDLDVERLAAVLISCVNSDGNHLYPLHGACLFQSAPVGRQCDRNL